MTYEEEIVFAFYQVWNQRSEIFRESVSSASLDELQQQLLAVRDASIIEVCQVIDEWIAPFEDLTAVVEDATRGIRPENNDRPSLNDRTLHNQYPQISETLQQFTANLEPSSHPDDPQPERSHPEHRATDG